jgi:hypothetical protein
MQKFNFAIQYIKNKENVVAIFFSPRPFINAMSLLKESIFDTIEEFYKENVYFSIPFESLTKKSRIQLKVDKFFAYIFDVDILYHKSRSCVYEVGVHKKNIIHDCHNIFIQVIEGFKKHMRQ